MIRLLCCVLTWALLTINFHSPTAAQVVEKTPANNPNRELAAGLFQFEPYLYPETDGFTTRWTGLDYELLELIFKKLGAHTRYEETSWLGQLEAVKEGVQDFTFGVFYSDERAEYGHFSTPYRQEHNVVLVRKGTSNRFDFSDAYELRQMIRNRKIKLGIIDGWITADKQLNELIQSEEFKDQFVKEDSDFSNMQNLLSRNVDGVIADRLTAATFAWKQNIQDRIEQHPGFSESGDIYVLFSKKTVDRSFVDRFNRELVVIQREGTYSGTMHKFLLPVLLGMTIDTSWFFVITVVGTIAFALSGVLLAFKENYSIFGAFVLGLLPALGGGVMRDLVVNRTPLNIVAEPIFLYIVILTVFFGFLTVFLLNEIADRYFVPLKRLADQHFTISLVVSDAIGLAAFTISGVFVAIEVNVQPAWLWGGVLAVLTSAGGGILRDVIRSDPDIPTLKTQFYPEIAFIWGSILTYFLHSEVGNLDQNNIFLGVILIIVATFFTRLFVYYKGIPSPSFSVLSARVARKHNSSDESD